LDDPESRTTLEEMIGAEAVAEILTGKARIAKLDEISEACKAAIYAGVELDGKHYSLTTEDQINISNLAMQAASGAESVLYHADGELCSPYSAAAILALAEAVTRHKIYHTTYCNHLNTWIRRATESELNSIVYGAKLPSDLAAHMQTLIGNAQS
jgi:hypothetical protein